MSNDDVKYVLFRHGGLLLVVYDDGSFGIQRDGVPMRACPWESQRLYEGVRAFRDMELRLLDDGQLSRTR
jgi:hypothetical protein